MRERDLGSEGEMREGEKEGENEKKEGDTFHVVFLEFYRRRENIKLSEIVEIKNENE